MVSLLGPGMPPFSHQDLLDSAGRCLDKHIQDDQAFLDLGDLLNVHAENQLVSGLQDLDYPCLSDTGMDPLSEMMMEKRVPLPPELVEQFGRMQCNCMMGLFPEIERAWLSVDSDIFMWKYEDGSDLAYFDGLGEAILSVALLHPKPGIFQPHIRYLLCLATPVDIVLLGVSFYSSQDGSSGDHTAGELHLLPDPLFSIPTDGVYITSIVGTHNGRVFMAGKDGCLYELIYQAEDGWFSRKCRKVNHSTNTFSFVIPSFLNFSFNEDDPIKQISVDNSRGILFARTQNGSIQVFDLGSDMKGMSRVATKSQACILGEAANIARTIEKSNLGSIVHIGSITRQESDAISLVAVTETGVRLYFLTGPYKHVDLRPTTLALVHVRLPPGFSATSTSQPSQVHLALHSNGTLLLVSAQSKEHDLLWTVSADSFPFQKQLMEAHTTIPVDGKTWALEEVTTPYLPSVCPSPTDSTKRLLEPPAVVTQHAMPPRRFVLLCAQGVVILRKLRPVEQLRQLLLECEGPDADNVKVFFKLHKEAEACATCLVLACSRASRTSADQQIADWARMAFFMYGGKAQYNLMAFRPPGLLNSSMSGAPGSPGFSNTSMYGPGSLGTSIAPGSPMAGSLPPLHMSTPAPHAMMAQMGANPLMQTPSGAVSQDISYSGKHNGIFIYLARILRPLWDKPLCQRVTADTKQGPISFFQSSFSVDQLTLTLELTRDLADFVDFNSKFDQDSQVDMLSMSRGLRFEGGAGGGGPMDEHTHKRLQLDVQRLEKVSLQHLQELLHRTEEVLGLWGVLLEHQVHAVVAALPTDAQNQLRSTTFKNLVVAGKEMCTTLINALISRYLDDNAAIDAFSDKLREVCPNLYSADDAICSKANELLQAARSNQNSVEKQAQMREALRLLKSVSQPLNLSVLCPQLTSAYCHLAVVELGLAEARKADPQQLAVHFYSNGEPQEDIQGMQAYMARMDCYKCITDTLAMLWTASTSHPGAPSVPTQPGPPVPTDPAASSSMDPQQALAYREEMLSAALRCDDPLFHAALYDWLFATNHSEKLLEINSPHVERYLRRKVNLQSDNIGALDMLWKHYKKAENFPAATHILAQLAERHGPSVPLSCRVEFLSRAVLCAKSSTSRLGRSPTGELLHQLEEKMEVARLQLKVQKCLCNLPNGPVQQEAIAKLDSNLLDITTLYEDFADRFDLHEVKLAIVHCAGLYDAALIEDLWHNVIDKEFLGTSQMLNSDKVISLRAKLSQIAKLYITAERYFPLAFILRHLEQKSCEAGLDCSWVFLLMLELGVSPAKLLELYDSLYKAKDLCWQSMKQPLRVVDVLAAFLEHIASNPVLIPVSERRRLTVTCMDTLATYLVELQAISSTDHKVRILTSNLKATQAKLDRV